METNSAETIVREILVEGLDDWVPVDRVIGLAREVAVAESEKFQIVAIGVIKSLIERGLMDAGEIGDSGFERWGGDLEDVAARVVAICESFNWEPFGAACWLANTDKGSARAREV